MSGYKTVPSLYNGLSTRIFTQHLFLVLIRARDPILTFCLLTTARNSIFADAAIVLVPWWNYWSWCCCWELLDWWEASSQWESKSASLVWRKHSQSKRRATVLYCWCWGSVLGSVKGWKWATTHRTMWAHECVCCPVSGWPPRPGKSCIMSQVVISLGLTYTLCVQVLWQEGSL